MREEDVVVTVGMIVEVMMDIPEVAVVARPSVVGVKTGTLQTLQDIAILYVS
jgi:hypothetical protein